MPCCYDTGTVASDSRTSPFPFTRRSRLDNDVGILMLAMFFEVSFDREMFKAMFRLYRTDFRSGSEIDPIQCEQCSEKSNRTGPIRS